MKINTLFMKYIIFSIMFILQIATSYALMVEESQPSFSDWVVQHENKRANEAEQWADVVQYQAEEIVSQFYLKQK